MKAFVELHAAERSRKLEVRGGLHGQYVACASIRLG